MIAALWLIVETIGSLLASACVIRALSWRVHLSPHNPISQFVNAVTDWLVKPLRKIVPSTRNTDWGSLIAALLVAMITAAIYAIMFSTGRIPVFDDRLADHPGHHLLGESLCPDGPGTQPAHRAPARADSQDHPADWRG
jgi:uncharacterized protein YggT (Ycf19 family)